MAPPSHQCHLIRGPEGRPCFSKGCVQTMAKGTGFAHFPSFPSYSFGRKPAPRCWHVSLWGFLQSQGHRHGHSLACHVYGDMHQGAVPSDRGRLYPPSGDNKATESSCSMAQPRACLHPGLKGWGSCSSGSRRKPCCALGHPALLAHRGTLASLQCCVTGCGCPDPGVSPRLAC